MSRSRILVISVLGLTLLVMGLGAAVVVVKVRAPAPAASPAERAVDAWEGSARADPKNEWAQVGLGMALLNADRRDEAQQAFKHALSLNDENWMALFQLGLLIREDAAPRAESLLERAAKFAPRTSKAGPLVALGDLRMAAEDADGARKAYRRAVADVPFLIDAHLGLARAFEALGETGAAVDQYREAARFDPSNREATEAIARLTGGG